MNRIEIRTNTKIILDKKPNMIILNRSDKKVKLIEAGTAVKCRFKTLFLIKILI